MLPFSPSLLTFTIVGCGSIWGSSAHNHFHGHSHLHFRRADTAQLFNFTGLEGLSSGCVQAMESPVSCFNDGMVLLNQGFVNSGFAAPEKLTADDLTKLCTTTCSNSLASLKNMVKSACSNDILTLEPSNSTVYLPGTNAKENIFGGGNETFRPSSALDRVLLNYNIACLKDSSASGSDAWCYLRSNGSQAGNCDECELGAFRAQMEDPGSYDSDLAAQYTSQVSSCGKSLAPITTPTDSVFISSATATETQTCIGTMVPVSADDDCADFSRAHSIGTEQLLSLNGLTSGCVGFPGSKSSLCVVGSCKTYTVAQGDTCSSIVKAAGIAAVQFLSWNPMLSTRGCNLDIARMVGRVVCVGNPLPYTAPVVTGSGLTTTSASLAQSRVAFDDLEDVSTIWTHDPLPTAATTTATGAMPWITPTFDLANGSLSGCYYMYDNAIDNLGCMSAANMYGVDVETWVRWNPSVQKGNLSELGNCYLEKDTRYCGLFWDPQLALTSNDTESDYATRPSDATAGATDKCYTWSKTPDSSTENMCDEFLNEWRITVDQLFAWNPAVGNNCQNLWLDTSYCVFAYDPTSDATSTTTAPTSTKTSGAPAPTRPGTVAGCQEWYVAQSDDSCGEVATAHGITLAQFTSWNADVNASNCDGFWPNYAYCVKGPAATGTSTTKVSSTSATKVIAPGPTQSGIPENCNKYAIAQDGDGCELFATRNSITINNLYEWNTALENACHNFWVDEAYCIGISS